MIDAGLYENSAEPQLSVLAPAIVAASTVTFPVPSRYAVVALHVAVGAILSCTEMILPQVAMFELSSVTVNTTVDSPRLLQLYEDWLRLYESPEQLSLLPLSAWLVVRVAFPLPSSISVTSWQTAVGCESSVMVTEDVQEAEFSLASETIRVAVMVPVPLQSKLL